MTVVLKVMFRLAIVNIAVLLLGQIIRAAPEVTVAPNIGATPANQLVVSGNACGPASLLNAFRFGNKDWQRALIGTEAVTDKQRILRIIKEIGMRPSSNMPGHPRWSRRGISVADLQDMANEMVMGRFLPRISEEVLFLTPRETPANLLRRIHQRLETSLAKGLPPIVSLRRYVLRASGGNAPAWIVVDAHFVTVTSIPHKLDKNAASFPVSYIDPWGGKRLEGLITIPSQPVFADAHGNSSCMIAVFPKTSVGNQYVRSGERSVLTVSAAVGRW